MVWSGDRVVLSPVLNNVYLIEMMKYLVEKSLGIEVEGARCGGLLYEDYIMLLVRDKGELQVMLDVVGKYVMKWRFMLNSKKSKTMMVGGECSGGERKINEERMEDLEIFKFHGVWFGRGMRGNVHL